MKPMARIKALLLGALIALGPIPPAHAQGVPVFDAQRLAQVQALFLRIQIDLQLQGEMLDTTARLLEIKQEQLDSLASIHSTLTLSGNDVAGTVSALENGPASEASAEEIFSPVDNNPGAALMFGRSEDDDGSGLSGGDTTASFGDASGTVEELIIRVAKETHSLPGVGRAGLSVVQWRALLQAMIWQESRFVITARSSVGAYGLTQVMPGTAQDLGIYPDYYESPYLQVHGGARYLAQMLNMFDGSIVVALAAYNAGPGNVQRHGGVPPFAETQHYVQVVPERYNYYLGLIGGVDALGTIDPVLLSQSTMSLTAHGAGVYGDYSLTSVQAAAQRVAAIIERIDQTQDVHEAIALNTYARAELARLIAIRIRLSSAGLQPASAEQILMAARILQERQFMNMTLEDF